MPYEKIREASIKVYKTFVRNFLKDHAINEEERKVLYILAEKLLISREQAEELEKKWKGEIYNEQLSLRLSDKNLTTREEHELARIRNILGLADEDIYRATKENATKAYKMLFHKFAESGILNTKELEELLRLSRSSGMSPEKAAGISQENAQDLYRRTVAMICQDKIITEEEQNIVEKLEDLLQLLQLLDNLGGNESGKRIKFFSGR